MILLHRGEYPVLYEVNGVCFVVIGFGACRWSIYIPMYGTQWIGR